MIGDSGAQDYSDLYEAAGAKHNVDPALLRAIVQQESRGNANTPNSPKGAIGIAQIMPKTAQSLGIDPKNPAQAIDGAAQLLSESLDRNNGDVGQAIAEYHGGPDRKIWGPKTAAYQKAVLAAYQGAPSAVPAQGMSDDDILAMASGKAPTSSNPVAQDPDDVESILKMASGGSPEFDAQHPKMVGPSELSSVDLKTYTTLLKGGKLDADKPYGDESNPFFNTDPKQVPAGAYFVQAGKLQRAPGGPKESSLAAGLGQGVADVATSLSHLAPGTDDSDVKNALLANEMTYGAKYGGDLKSGTGRFTGQMAATVPLMLTGEGAVAPVLSKLGPVGDFIAGQGAKNLSPGLLRLLGRGASLATKGAQEGAVASGLTSASDNAPVSDQMAQGALGGAIVGPLAPAITAAGRGVGNVAREIAEPFLPQGPQRIANRIVGDFAHGPIGAPNADEIIPGSTPTLAQAQADPGLATLERSVRLTHGGQFAERDVANAEARSNVLEGLRGDEQTVADLVNSRRAAVEGAEQTAFTGAGQANPQSVVHAIDAALTSPDAHMEEVAAPLRQLRDKVVSPPPETTPEQHASFNRAVAQTFGADAPSLTPEVMSDARARLGQKFEEIAGKTEVPWDDKLRSDIGGIIKNTADVVPESSLPPLFKQLDNIASTAEGKDAISGASYQALTKKGAPLTSLQNSGDPTIRDAANQIREALDDALERSVASNPEGAQTLADLRNTRLQYKNLKTVEAALKGAGPDKQVTPQAVMSAVKRNFGQFAYQGGGPLGDAAEAALREEISRAPTLESDPRQLFGMRNSLSTAIDKLTARGTDAADVAARRLTTVRDALDSEIGNAAPGYADYLRTVQSTAEPVAATKYLQGLRLTDAQGKITLAKVGNALDRIATDRAKPGHNPAKAITPDTLAQLQAIHADLLREANSKLALPINSVTMQHATVGDRLQKLGVPGALGLALTHHPVAAAAVPFVRMAYGAKDKQIMGEVANRLLNPQPIKVAPKITKPQNRIVERLAAPIAPSAAGIIANQLTAPR